MKHKFGISKIYPKMREENLRLTIELIPSTVWFSSLYQIYKTKGQLSKWKKIKKELLKKEGKRCWICGAENTRLEAHEFWEFDDRNHIQRLIAIHHLCSMCHKIKHIGFWCYTENGRRALERAGLSRDDLIRHFCEVNGCSVEEFLRHEKEAFRVWKERSKYQWKQEFGDLELNGESS